MAVTLFLSLVLASSTASAQEEVGDFGQLGREGIDQPILEKRLSLEGQKRRAYRGGVDNLLNNTVSVWCGDSLGAGVVLDDASAQSVLPMMSADMLRGKSLIVTNFHVIDPVRCLRCFLRLLTAWIWIQVNYLPLAFSVRFLKKTWRSCWCRIDLPMSLASVWLLSLEIILVTMWRLLDTLRAKCGRIREAISQVRADYEWSYNEGFTLKADVVQTQTPISTGNSGGPLFNRQGN